MSQKPSIPKGTRDFLPNEMLRRNYIFDTIQSVYQKYGFSPIETPAVEKLSTLTGKYGEEGDRLIFKILNSGQFAQKVNEEDWNARDEQKILSQISEKALRYDLTVPFARFVVQHQNELNFPFKRYQMQPVWRADRPQKGRYREFYQCDADVVGSDSLLYEVDFVQIFDDVLSQFGLPGFTIKINNRKILAGIAEVIDASDQLTAITVAIDKLDKIGQQGVLQELSNIGLPDDKVQALLPIFTLEEDNRKTLSKIAAFVDKSEIGKKGIEELSFVLDQVDNVGLKQGTLIFEPTLARGLDYYTGAIYEVVANDVDMGSICGGGRYDDLTGIFGKEGLSGVGISFGAERIYDILEQLDLFPETTEIGIDAFFVNFGNEEMNAVLQLAKVIREAGCSVDVYPDPAKMKKQMKHANNIGARYVIMLGKNEIASKTATIKNMENGEQMEVAFDAVVNTIKKITNE